MAGLLEFLNTDDARLGIGLLAAGGPSTVPMSVGQRVAGALQGMDADKQNKLRLSLLQSQVDENSSQAALRKQQLALAERKQAWDEQFMGGGLTGAAPAGLGAAPGAGVPGASGVAGPAPAGGFTAAQISQQFGLPMEAVIADYRFNGGKKIAELIADRTKANWQNVNGNLVNTNAPGFSGGLQGGMAASNDGKVTAWQPDGQGGVVVGAPRGAMETYGAYQGISNRSSADFTPQEVIGPDGRRVVKPRSEVLQPRSTPQAPANQVPDYRPALQGLPPAQPGMTSSFQGPPEQVLPLIAGMKDRQERSNAYEAYSRQMTGPGAAMSAAGNVVELSPAEQTRIATDKEYKTGVVKDEVEQRKTIVSAGFQAPSRIAKLQQINTLLGDFEGGKLSQAGVDFASAMNSLGIKVDKNLPNKEAAMAMSREIALSLRNPAGGAGMPGAMSDADRNFLQSMTPDIGQTAEGRRKIIQAGIAVEERNRQVADFARKYEKKYGQLNNDFYSQLSQWSSANPLFGK